MVRVWGRPRQGAACGQMVRETIPHGRKSDTPKLNELNSTCAYDCVRLAISFSSPLLFTVPPQPSSFFRVIVDTGHFAPSRRFGSVLPSDAEFDVRWVLTWTY